MSDDIELSNLTKEEAAMSPKEFNENIEKINNEILDDTMAKVEDQVTENLTKNMTDSQKQIVTEKIKDGSAKIKTNLSNDITEFSSKENPTDGYNTPLDKQMQKSMVENSGDLASKATDEALGTPPNADNLTDNNIKNATDKVSQEHSANVKEAIKDGLQKEASDAVEQTAIENGLDMKDPTVQSEVKEVATNTGECIGELTDPTVRKEVGDLSNKINSDEKTNDPNVEEGRKWKQKIYDAIKKAYSKMDLGILMKLCGVVAAIMLLTNGGRNILNKGAGAIGGAAAAGTQVVANFAVHAFGPLIEEIETFFSNLGKYVWIIIAIVGFMILVWIFSRLRGSGRHKIEIESSSPSHSSSVSK